MINHNNNTKPLVWDVAPAIGYKATINKHFAFTIKGYNHELTFNDHRIGKYASLEEAQLAAQNYLDVLLEDIAGEDIKEATYWKNTAQELSAEVVVLQGLLKENEAEVGELL